MRLCFERYFSNYRPTSVIMIIFKANTRNCTRTIELADLGEKKLRNTTNESN